MQHIIDILSLWIPRIVLISLITPSEIPHNRWLFLEYTLYIVHSISISGMAIGCWPPSICHRPISRLGIVSPPPPLGRELQHWVELPYPFHPMIIGLHTSWLSLYKSIPWNIAVYYSTYMFFYICICSQLKELHSTPSYYSLLNKRVFWHRNLTFSKRLEPI